MGEYVKEATLVRNVLGLIQPGVTGQYICIYDDNEGAIALTKNPLSLARTKHIDVRHYFLKASG